MIETFFTMKFYRVLLLVFCMLNRITLSNGQLPEGEIAITASSTLPASSTADFNPENIMDGTAASWSEGAAGDGIGEFIQIELRYPDYLRYVMIKNGYGVKKHWKSNGRVKQLRISNGEGEYRDLYLEDTPELRVYGLQEPEADEYGVLMARDPLYGDSFTFEIIDIYPGDKWSDLCISELALNNWYFQGFHMEPDYIVTNIYRTFFSGVLDGQGNLYLESDWEGYILSGIEEGYYYSEITSGDGTTGQEEYQALLDTTNNTFYLFQSQFISEISAAGQTGKKDEQGRPERQDNYSWGIFIYDNAAGDFRLLDNDEAERLFKIFPSAVLSKAAGHELLFPDVWLSVDSPGVIKALHLNENGITGQPIYYRWNGKKFELLP